KGAHVKALPGELNSGFEETEPIRPHALVRIVDHELVEEPVDRLDQWPKRLSEPRQVVDSRLASRLRQLQGGVQLGLGRLRYRLWIDGKAGGVARQDPGSAVERLDQR